MDYDQLNGEIKNCRKCSLSESRTNVICGEGKLDAKLMLIAQAPGEQEDIAGRMFIGPSGKVLDELLKSANLNRDEFYMTNLIKCMLPRYRRPKEDEIEMCSWYLDREIELINPRVLVPLGYYATRYIFRKYALQLTSRKDFYTVYGKLFFSRGQKILPLTHPAALLYNPSFKKEMTKSYSKMNILLEDCKWYPVCPMKRFYEEGVLDEKWVELYCKGDWESCIRYQMEERGELHPDSMLPDGSVDKRLDKL